MRKEHVFIVFLLLAIVVGVVFFGLYVVAQKNLETSRDQLKAGVAEIEKRYQQYVKSKTQPAEENIPNPPASGENVNEINEDTVIALEQVVEKIYSLESEERKHNEFDAIYFTEKYWDELPDNIKQLVKDFFRGNRDLIFEIRQLAATGGPFGRLDFSQGSKMETPHFAKIRECLRLLRSNAFIATLSGDYEDAAKDYIAIMQFAESISKEPAFISQLSKNSFFEQAFRGINEYVPGERLSSDMVLEIIKQSSFMVGREACVESLKMEIVISMAIFDEIRSGDYEPTFKPRGLDALIERFNASIIGRPFLLMDEQAYVDTMDRISEIIRLPYYQAKPQLDRIDSEIDYLPITSSTSRIVLPLYTTYFPEEQAKHEARIGLLQVGLAVELHHGQHGVYPQTLDEIAPTLGGEVPLDPYTGEYFVYEPGEDNFLLYSARSTVIDDPAGAQFVSYTDDDGNLVWRGPRDWRESEYQAQDE